MKYPIASALLVSCFAFPSAASTLIKNVQGYTINNGELVRFVGLEFDQGKVTHVYSDSEQLNNSQAEQQLDGQGNTLLPGLIDAHGHVLSHGIALNAVQLRGTQSEEEAAAKVMEFVLRNPNASWIRGRGWNQELWQSKAFPSAKSISLFTQEKPVALSRVDGHALWVNEEALKRAGIDKDTPDPAGGKIIRDAQGHPTGVLIDNAMSLITDIIPPLSGQELETVLVNAMQDLARQGLTSVHDAGIYLDNLAAYQRLAKSGKMPIRINAMLDVTEPGYGDLIKLGTYSMGGDMLKVDSVKISADGALGSRGAALHQDYSDHAGNKGLLLHSDDRLKLYIESAMAYGFQVNTHAIGDRANSIVLDNYAHFIAKTDSQDRRHRIEHAQVLRVEELSRFQEMGIIASMQPTHATSDKNMAEDRLGPKRMAGAYAWRDIIATGAMIAGGSDFPVESANPFYGIHAAVTRQDHDNQPTDGWFPKQRLSREEALQLFTTNAAYAGHQETLIGHLAPGMAADFILVDQDIFKIDEAKIWQTQVEQTWVAGQRVH